MAVNLLTLLKSTNIPTAYGKFKTVQTPPYITYRLDNTVNVFADNKVQAVVNNYRIELYSGDRDLVSEGKIETALGANELPWDKTEIPLPEENLVMVVYEISN